LLKVAVSFEEAFVEKKKKEEEEKKNWSFWQEKVSHLRISNSGFLCRQECSFSGIYLNFELAPQW
jgi:hypothetical protein